jgi:hypothetical protein
MLTNQQASNFVVSSYQAIFGRNPGDMNVLQPFITQIAEGQMTTDGWISRMLSNSEYLQSQADQANWLAMGGSTGFYKALASDYTWHKPTINKVSTTTVNVIQPVVGSTSQNSPIVSMPAPGIPPSTIGFTLPNLAFNGFSSTEVYLGLGALAVVGFFMFSGGRR